MYNENGLILWEGKSLLDGAPIVAIMTGLKTSSANSKTGDMLQTFIIRQDVKPTDAVKDGSDVSICGDCPHRAQDGTGRTCYVNVGHGPLAVWKAYRNGRYRNFMMGKDTPRIANRFIRFGTYGDPAAIPLNVWLHLSNSCAGHTGYTHQWRTRPEYLAVCMASVDSMDDAIDAREAGYRYFRVSPFDGSPIVGEVVCPASEEAGKKLTCNECRACEGGTKRNSSIVIRAHGAGASEKNLTNLIARV